MSAALTILQAGPSMSVQDLGRPGYRAQGLTRGGAADPVALYEGAALLGQASELAALEMAGSGGTFRAEADLRIALTGAEMAATRDGEALAWNASHSLPAGATLTLGGARNGSYGYLHLGGGIDTEPRMGGRGAHLAGGVGGLLEAGESLPAGRDRGGEVGLTFTPLDRFGGGEIRIVASMQTDSFDRATLERFTGSPFKRDARANRMGVRLAQEGLGYSTEAALSIVSEVVVPGDIQIAGDGAPYVLMGECQTTGGYPRIGTVLPCDLPRVAQALDGASLSFRFVEMAEAVSLQARFATDLAALRGTVTPLLRDPAGMRDLLSYQLIGGAVSATANPFEKET